MRVRLLLPALAVLIAPAAGAQSAPALVREGRALVGALECNRCHGGAALQVGAAPRERSCAGCHAWIKGSATDPAEYARQSEQFPYWKRYVENVESFLAVPDLAVSGARLDEAWIASYVRDPYVVRPAMHERMLRAPVTEAEAKAIAAFLVSARPALSARASAAAAIPPSREPAHLEEGRRLYERLKCGTCHALAGIDERAGNERAGTPRDRVPRDAVVTAPDLAHVRDRMRPADVAAFIADPAAFGVTAMPSFDLTAPEAARVRDYLVFSALRPAAPVADPEELPLLARAVEWEEVRTRVFGRVCVHCHMDPAANGGEGGPGNTGGLGFAGKKLDLESWAGIARSKVLVPAAPGADPPLLARLRAREAEHARELAGAPGAAPAAERGMPLALPPLTPEEMQLVRSWIAQGAPGPNGERGAGGPPESVRRTLPAGVAGRATARQHGGTR